MKKQLLSSVLNKHHASILEEWSRQLTETYGKSGDRISAKELQVQAREFFDLLVAASQKETSSSRQEELEEFLSELSKTRVLQGFSSEETAIFIFSLKGPIFKSIRSEYGTDPDSLAQATWEATERLDSLGLFTVNAFQKTREQVIARQQDELLELSTPVVKLWEGILALPLIGTLDSVRTQVVMESLLQRIVETGSSFAILDITGVPMVDTMVAQHLLKAVTAIRLMGADCIISGIRPQIAQTIVHLGVDLGGVTTKATLADALELAIRKSGLVVTRAGQT